MVVASQRCIWFSHAQRSNQSQLCRQTNGDCKTLLLIHYAWRECLASQLRQTWICTPSFLAIFIEEIPQIKKFWIRPFPSPSCQNLLHQHIKSCGKGPPQNAPQVAKQQSHFAFCLHPFVAQAFVQTNKDKLRRPICHLTCSGRNLYKDIFSKVQMRGLQACKMNPGSGLVSEGPR